MPVLMMQPRLWGLAKTLRRPDILYSGMMQPRLDNLGVSFEEITANVKAAKSEVLEILLH